MTKERDRTPMLMGILQHTDPHEYGSPRPTVNFSRLRLSQHHVRPSI